MQWYVSIQVILFVLTFTVLCVHKVQKVIGYKDIRSDVHYK